MKIVITGGAGFIGANLATLAANQGLDVVVLDDLSTGYRDNLDSDLCRLVEGNILDLSLLLRVFRGADSVIHLAALGSVPRSIQDPCATHAANATGTLSVLEAARSCGVSHLITASSSSVYGLNPALPKTEREWVRPMSPYAVSKLAAEQYTLSYQQAFGLRTLAFRFFNVYGPLQRAGHAYAAVIPVFVDAMLRDQQLPLHGDGTQSRDFTYVGAVTNVLLDAATRGVSHPEPVNLAFGINTTLLALISELEDLIGFPADVANLPARAGDVQHSQANNDTLISLFPSLVPVSLHDGLRHTVEWFKENKCRILSSSV